MNPTNPFKSKGERNQPNMKPNPFKRPKKDELSAEQALSDIFADPKAGEMMDRMTDAPRAREQELPSKIGDDVAKKIEDYEAAQAHKYRADFIEWLSQAPLDGQSPEEWLSTRPDVKFSAKGITMDSLVLFEDDISELPPHLVEIVGTLTLWGCPIEDLTNLPKNRRQA